MKGVITTVLFATFAVTISGQNLNDYGLFGDNVLVTPETGALGSSVLSGLSSFLGLGQDSWSGLSSAQDGFLGIDHLGGMSGLGRRGLRQCRHLVCPAQFIEPRCRYTPLIERSRIGRSGQRYCLDCPRDICRGGRGNRRIRRRLCRRYGICGIRQGGGAGGMIGGGLAGGGGAFVGGGVDVHSVGGTGIGPLPGVGGVRGGGIIDGGFAGGIGRHVDLVGPGSHGSGIVGGRLGTVGGSSFIGDRLGGGVIDTGRAGFIDTGVGLGGGVIGTGVGLGGGIIDTGVGIGIDTGIGPRGGIGPGGVRDRRFGTGAGPTGRY